MTERNLRVLIVAEHASLQFGGEAALPLHYFRVLRQRGVETWLIVHDRTESELRAYFPDDADRIHFVRDTGVHRILWRCSRLLPSRLGYFTFGFLMRLLTQQKQRRMARRLVRQCRIDVVHQPIPVSPREPSLLFNVGAPVVIGPMNGGMTYPPGFEAMQHRLVGLGIGAGRVLSNVLNRLIPGKRRARLLLVANERTRKALPASVCREVIELVENGVDLALWQAPSQEPEGPDRPTVAFVYVGRLVDWKAVDLLLEAFARLRAKVAATLTIIGDGPLRAELEAQSRRLGIAEAVTFTGWLAQRDCAGRLRSADVLVLPSLLECGGAVVLEAMAMGLAVIATDWGGPADYVDESCGILVPPRSRAQFVDDLAEAMRKLAESPALRQQMGLAGRRRVETHFDWQAKAATILQIYRRAMGADPP